MWVLSVFDSRATKVRTRCLKNSLQFPRYLKIHLSEIFDARTGDSEVCPQNHKELRHLGGISDIR